MPLLRLPHDYHRVLRARRITARSAIAPSGSQDRDAMTASSTSSQRPPSGGYWLRCRRPIAPRPADAGAMPPVTPKSPSRKRQRQCSVGCNRQSRPTPSLGTSSATAAPPANRHRPPPPTPPIAGSFPGGFRTPGGQIAKGRRRKPFTTAVAGSRPPQIDDVLRVPARCLCLLFQVYQAHDPRWHDPGLRQDRDRVAFALLHRGRSTGQRWAGGRSRPTQGARASAASHLGRLCFSIRPNRLD
jgi:hypothetical protein